MMRLLLVIILFVACINSSMAVNMGRPMGVQSWHSVNGKIQNFTLKDGNKIDRSNISLYRQKAEKGDIYAVYIVGVQYHLGFDVPVDKEMASQYYLEASRAGMPWACLELGFDYDYTLDERINWLEKASEGNILLAMTELAQIYRVNKDDNETALKWSIKLAEFREPFGCLYAGEIYEEMKNFENALIYYEKVIDLLPETDDNERGLVSMAYRRIGEMIQNNHIKGLSQEDSFHYRREAYALEPNEWTAYSLAYCFETGYGVKQNYKIAFHLYSSSELPQSKVRLAYLYYFGLGIEQDYEKSVQLLLELQKNQWYIGSVGYEILSRCYRLGRGGLNVDLEKANYYTKMSEEKNFGPTNKQ